VFYVYDCPWGEIKIYINETVFYTVNIQLEALVVGPNAVFSEDHKASVRRKSWEGEMI